MPSTKDLILDYLRSKRDSEVPVSELVETLHLKRPAISNAIKELELKDLITVERRPLRRGKYTVMHLKGHQIKHRYTHPKEFNPPEKRLTPPVSPPQPEKQISDDVITHLIHEALADDFSLQAYLDLLGLYGKNTFEIVADLLMTTLAQVGMKWAENHLSPAEEHVITTRFEKLVTELINTKQLKNRQDLGKIMLVTVEGEHHKFTLLTLEVLLVERGYKVINLGGDLPMEDIVGYVRQEEPNWILISITMPAYIGTLRRVVKALDEEFPGLKIAVGGQGVSSEEERNSLPEADYVIPAQRDSLYNFLYNVL